MITVPGKVTVSDGGKVLIENFTFDMSENPKEDAFNWAFEQLQLAAKQAKISWVGNRMEGVP